MYPSYYLWSCEIFETQCYLDFEEKLLSCVDDSNNEFSVSQRAQFAMPEITTAIKNGFESLLALQRSQNISHTRQVEEVKESLGNLRQDISNFFSLGNSFFQASSAASGSPGPSGPIISTSVRPPSSSSATEADSSSLSLPKYVMNRSIQTVTDIWREYEEGLPGQPSVKSLNEKFRSSWRRDAKENKFYSRRKEIYAAIEEIASTKDITCKQAAKKLEEKRTALNISAYKLRELVKKHGVTYFTE